MSSHSRAKTRRPAPRQSQPQPTPRPASGPALLDLQRAAGNQAVEAVVKNDPPPFAAPVEAVTQALGPGQPLPGGVRHSLEAQVGASLEGVQVHTGPQAHTTTTALQADALAAGKHIAFRGDSYQPGTPAGQELLLHEARHVVAAGTSGGSQTVQRMVAPLDVGQEMVGLTFSLRRETGSPPQQIPAGAHVVVTAWQPGEMAEVRYQVMGREIRIEVPKLLLTPVTPGAAGVRRYETGLEGQQRAVEKYQEKTAKGRDVVTDRLAQKGKPGTNAKTWEDSLLQAEAELVRLESEQQTSEKAMEEMLIQQTMYNRFDPIIQTWVRYYNEAFKPAENLDPNLVKSILFNESRMGTSGKHLKLPGESGFHPGKSRFNLGQAVDSMGPQQYLMIKEMAPDIYAKYGLGELEKQARWKGMKKEYDTWNGGAFLKALDEFWQARDPAGNNRMGSPGKNLNVDYSFWIRTSVRWLFYKYFSLAAPNWPEAAEAYNTRGNTKYRQDVMSRVGSDEPLKVGNR